VTTVSDISTADLTPAEALVLLDGPPADGRLALKLTLLDLMADGLLLLPPDTVPAVTGYLAGARSRPGTANPFLLSPLVGQTSKQRRHRAAVIRILALTAPPGSNGSFRQARPFLRTEFGADASGFVSGCLLPDLIDRAKFYCPPPPRLLPKWCTNLLGHPGTQAQVTPAGKAARTLWADRKEAARLLASDLHERTDSAARREDLEGIALLAARADTALLLVDESFTAADQRLIRRALLERAGMSTAMRLPRLLALAEHHGRRLTRGVSLQTGIDHITPQSSGYESMGF